MPKFGYKITVQLHPQELSKPTTQILPSHESYRSMTAFIETGIKYSPEDALTALHRMLEISGTLRSTITVEPVHMKEVQPNGSD